MSEVVDALIHDLLDWVAKEERPYAEVMEAWRTSCPRLPVWEEANDRGFIARQQYGSTTIVKITKAGRAFLEQSGH